MEAIAEGAEAGEKRYAQEEEEEEADSRDLSGRNAQEKLAELASSLMMAAAEQSRSAGEVEERSNSNYENDLDAETMPTKPLVKKTRKLLFRRLRVGVEDSRVFVGRFHCLDKQGNIILYDTVEYRQISPGPAPAAVDGESSCGSDGADEAVAEGGTTEQRSLGLVLIPARCRTSCHIECSLQEQFSLLSV